MALKRLVRGGGRVSCCLRHRRQATLRSNGRRARSRWWCPTASAASPTRWRALTADRLGKALNQTFVIENKLGAGGAIGVDYALNSPQDGYTILFRRQHAVHRPAAGAEGELRAAEGLSCPSASPAPMAWCWWSPRMRPTRRCANSSTMRGQIPARSPIRAAAPPPTIICRRPISPEKKASTWCMCRSAAARPR